MTTERSIHRGGVRRTQSKIKNITNARPKLKKILPPAHPQRLARAEAPERSRSHSASRSRRRQPARAIRRRRHIGVRGDSSNGALQRRSLGGVLSGVLGGGGGGGGGGGSEDGGSRGSSGRSGGGGRGRGRGGGLEVRLRGDLFPLAPAVEVDERLHAPPFFDFALEPHEVDGLGAEREC